MGWAAFRVPACLSCQPGFKRKPCSAIFIDTISSQSSNMPTKIVLFMSVSLLCLPSPGSLEKKKQNKTKQNKKNSTLTHANMSVYAFTVYCTSLLRALSHTSSCVVRYGRPQKNGGGSLKLKHTS